jgi:ElaB/YqjD/DUF883 family membrane-anchored ribosome-binding protein
MALPTAQALTAAMEVAGSSPEGAQHLAERLNEVLDKANISDDKVKELKKQVQEFVKSVELQLSRNEQAWNGKQGEVSPLKNMYSVIADLAVSILTERVNELTPKTEYLFNFAIKNGEFIRGYSPGDINDNTATPESGGGRGAG